MAFWEKTIVFLSPLINPSLNACRRCLPVPQGLPPSSCHCETRSGLSFNLRVLALRNIVLQMPPSLLKNFSFPVIRCLSWWFGVSVTQCLCFGVSSMGLKDFVRQSFLIWTFPRDCSRHVVCIQKLDLPGTVPCTETRWCRSADIHVWWTGLGLGLGLSLGLGLGLGEGLGVGLGLDLD